MLEEFRNHINNNLPFLKESKLLIAISGGLDSVVLTHLSHSLNLNITLAHCNFNLRGSESDADETFVNALAKQLDTEVFIESFNTTAYAKTEKLSIQMAARELRYDWFKDLSENLSFDYILTGHQADDNLETFFINLTRGSGLTGLIGIPEVNDVIVRPLLPFSRDELETYAKVQHLKWKEDSSNESDNYLRNKLRHHIIPQLKGITPELLSNFNKTVSNLKDTADIVDESLNAVAKRAIADIDEQQVKFKISEFIKVNNPKAYLYEMFKDYGFTEWNDIIGLLKAQSGKQVLSKTHRLIKDRKHLILTNRSDNVIQNDSKEPLVIKDLSASVETSFGSLRFDCVAVMSKDSKTKIFIDKDKLKLPLQLRRWEKGDLFYPSGMNGKKKLSKYFKDEKYSLIDKENTWLLCSEDDIIWIIGGRTDNRFKVTKDTKQILKITLTNEK